MPAATILNGAVIAVSGTHKGNNQAKIERLITSNGGIFAKAVDDTVTHLVTTDVDFGKKSNKVTQAQAIGAHIVTLEWLTESIATKEKKDEDSYLLESSSNTPAAQSGAPTLKRTATVIAPTEEAEVQEEAKPPAKKTRGRKAAPKDQEPEEMDVDEEEDEAPAPAKKTSVAKGKGKAVATKGKGRKATSVAKDEEVVKEEENMDIDEEEEEAPTKKAPAAKGKGKAAATKGKGKKAAVTKDDVEEEEGEEDKEEQKAPGMKTIIKKGKAPVDICFPYKDCHVYVDEAGVAYDATLNQTDIGKNSNKFYYIQLIESDSGNNYSTFVRYGRVGETGAIKMYADETALDVAMLAFEKQMKAKSGQSWENRANAHGGNKKYAYLERNYEDDEDEKDEKKDTSSSSKPVVEKVPDSRISEPLQNLMKLIFNSSYMEQQMSSMSYDANKLPLGKLSKDTIMKGYAALKEIDAVLESPATSTRDYSQYGSTHAAILRRLSERYYTVLPHSFGRTVPPVINSRPMLKHEIELVENLVDMKISAEIMQEANKTHDVHPLDKQFESLSLNEAVPLDKTSDEFKHLKAYLLKTQGKTHRFSISVEEIFRVTRAEEHTRFSAAGFDTLPNDSRKLLWHGSRTTNFSGILSQGLRIAPPQAPVNGYMFDKGIYLADIATKSANYCCAYNSDNTGLLLLCEAQLGDPMYELKDAQYNAASRCRKAGRLATKGLGRIAPLAWEDGGIISEELKNVEIPKVSGEEANITGQSGVSGACLMYNEYIVYNIAQVKIRYLFRCKFNYEQ